MKISNIPTLLCALALALSISSFTGDKENKKIEKDAKHVTFDAVLYQVKNTNKVKLAIDKGDESRLRIVLKDKVGKIFYSEVVNQSELKYRRTFDLDEMHDGTYYFELSYKGQKLTKEVDIRSINEKLISLE
jgi:hypothetical protein